MSDANVVKLLQPGSFADPLTEVLRNGARALLAQAIEAELAEFLAKHVDLKTATGLRRVVRHGHLPEREVMTRIGPVGVRQPRVRDRGAAEDDAGRSRFTPAILPPYARIRSKVIPSRARASMRWAISTHSAAFTRSGKDVDPCSGLNGCRSYAPFEKIALEPAQSRGRNGHGTKIEIFNAPIQLFAKPGERRFIRCRHRGKYFRSASRKRAQERGFDLWIKY